ncbi:MAG TPA: Fe-S cluster assembly protein SufD [Tepidisphaeraceae bacterium]|jgi:Fe-S cluster assembly protein SufD
MSQVADTLQTAPPSTWLDELRTHAGTEFQLSGLPKGREEAWRFTKIQPILRAQFAPAAKADGRPLQAKFTFGDEAGVEVVFVNGHYVPELSKTDDLPKGVTVATLHDAARGPLSDVVRKYVNRIVDNKLHPFAAYNAAHFTEGVFVHVKRGVTVEKPIHFLFASVVGDQVSVNHPRVLVVAEENSEATFVESYVGEAGTYLSNAVSEFVFGDDARIDHCKLQQESSDAFHTASMHVRIGKQTQFVSHAINTGAAVSRNDLSVRLGGQGGYATLNGLVLIGGNQHCDNHTLLDHAAPDCPSHELYKHVLADKASAVFKGQIFVNQIAQKTNAKQSSKALLLSDTAEMNSMPALEIYADDVKCTHGSTVGPVDDDLVFYLRSRGIGQAEARHLLTYAFAADVTRRIRVAPVRRRIEDFMAIQAGLPQDLRINDLGAFDEAVTR